MSVPLTDIADRIRDNLDAAFTGSDPKIEVASRMRVKPGWTPIVDIYPANSFRTPDEAGFGDIDGAVYLTVRARITTTDHEASQDVLFRMLDDNDVLSVEAALMDDQTTGGLTNSVLVQGTTGFGIYQDIGGDGAYLGCEWQTKILPNLSAT